MSFSPYKLKYCLISGIAGLVGTLIGLVLYGYATSNSPVLPPCPHESYFGCPEKVFQVSANHWLILLLVSYTKRRRKKPCDLHYFIQHQWRMYLGQKSHVIKYSYVFMLFSHFYGKLIKSSFFLLFWQGFYKAISGQLLFYDIAALVLHCFLTFSAFKGLRIHWDHMYMYCTLLVHFV